MKEAQIFENWINNLSEGTWALPETPEQMEKLNQLMSGELIVGPDATNATEQLYDIVGDDELFDILNDLADRSEGRANCWDDSDVQRRLAELGIQTPQSTQAEPADVDQDEAPSVKEQGMAEGANPINFDKVLEAIAALYGDDMWENDAMQDLANDLEQAGPTDQELDFIIARGRLPKRLAGIQFSAGDDVQFNESKELAEMLKYAGVPLREGVLTDSTGGTMEHIKDTYQRDIKDFAQTGKMSKHLFQALYDYYYDDMPYGARSSDGDPYEWISNRLSADLGLDENLISPMIMPVSEGSCNMTMEGSYCPEHGLAECGSMYEDSRSQTDPANHWAMPRSTAAGAGRGHVNPSNVKPSNPFSGSPSMGTLPGVTVTAPRYNPDLEPIRVDVRGIGNRINDIPAGEKFVNPIQPRKHNALSPLTPGDSRSHPPVAHVDLTSSPDTMEEGVYDPDYRGGYNNEFDELEDLLSRSGMSQDDLMRQRFLASKHGLNTPADMSKLPALKKDAETGYVARKAALDADLEKRNQQYLQDKLTDLEYQQDPVAFLKRRTQQLSPTAPTKPTAPTLPTDVAAEPGTDYSTGRAKLGSSPSVKLPNAGFSVDQFSSEPSAKVPAAEPGVDYSLPRAKLGSSPSAKFPNFRPDPSAEVPAPSDQTDTRNQKPSIFQQLAQLRNRTRGTMAENNMGLEPIERDPDWNTYDSEISGSTTVTNKDGKDSYVKKTTSTDTNPAGKKRYTTTTDADGVQTLDRRYADEGNDDPINSNSAMTGSYYEGKETRTQEGDALLARIKSLALLK